MKPRIVTFPTGWDSPDMNEVQRWALLEECDGIGQKPLDACPWICIGSTCYSDGGDFFPEHSFAFPSTIKRD